jgi:hypothetical protein
MDRLSGTMSARAGWRLAPTRVRRPVAASLLGLVIAATAGCRSEPAPLAAAVASPRALAEAVLAAIARRDRARLEALAVTAGEFRTRVWPELPASRPERNLPLEYVWGDLQQKSQAGLSALLAQHGGRRYTLVRLAFTGGSTRYDTFVVHRASTITVRDDTGTERDLRLFGSAIETAEGQVKVFSYVVD